MNVTKPIELLTDEQLNDLTGGSNNTVFITNSNRKLHDPSDAATKGLERAMMASNAIEVRFEQE